MPRRKMTNDEALDKGLAQAVEVGECLEWAGAYSCKGVTPVVKTRGDKGYTENTAAYRLQWERHKGPVPAGKKIYRQCANNACVRLEHLACGTLADVKKAQKKAGKTAHHETTKLAITMSSRRRANVVNDMDTARRVRELAAEGLTYPAIAKLTGVNIYMVAEIVRGEAWRELAASPFAGLFTGLLAANDSRRATA